MRKAEISQRAWMFRRIHRRFGWKFWASFLVAQPCRLKPRIFSSAWATPSFKLWHDGDSFANQPESSVSRDGRYRGKILPGGSSNLRKMAKSLSAAKMFPAAIGRVELFVPPKRKAGLRTGDSANSMPKATCVFSGAKRT